MKARARTHLRERGIWYLVGYGGAMLFIGSAVLRDAGSVTRALLPLAVLTLCGIVGSAIVFVMWILVQTMQPRGKKPRLPRR